MMSAWLISRIVRRELSSGCPYRGCEGIENEVVGKAVLVG